ncbi:MAG: hypothetical protein ABSF81_17635, partial [Bacteroidales bacterium]
MLTDEETGKNTGKILNMKRLAFILIFTLSLFAGKMGAQCVINVGGAMDAICQGGQSANLGGSYNGDATGAIWSDAVGGTFLNNDGLTPNTAIWIPPSSFSGTATLTLTAIGCVSTDTKNITVTPTPAATISYAGTPFCTSLVGGQPVTRTGTAGGTYSSTAGLTINSATGAITPSTSTAGFYTVTYTIAPAGGCGVVTATAPITITKLPVATFSYNADPYCSNEANPSPTFSGGGVAGIFSSTGGLVFVSTSTGQVNLAASTPGTHTVTNTIAAAGGCG